MTAVTAGFVLIIVFICYRLFGPELSGGLDKTVQLLVLVPAVILMSWSVSHLVRGDLAERFLRRLEDIPPIRFVAFLSVVLLAFTSWLAFGPLEGIPKGADEACYYFQSKIFANGSLSAPAPSIGSPGDFFPSRHYIFDGTRWFGMYPPVHPLVMAPFTALGLSALLGPLEGVLALLAAYLLIRRWAGERIARVSVVFLVLSPFFLLMIGTHMAHNTALMLITWAFYFLTRMVQDGKDRFGIAAGFLLGLALGTRPYTMVPVSIFIAVALIVRYRKRSPGVLAMVIAGGAIPTALFLLSNYYYTGSPLITTYTMARGDGLLGFWGIASLATIYGEHIHTPIWGIYNILLQAAVGGTILYGWPLISGIPMLFALRIGRRERRVFWLWGLLLLVAFFNSLTFAASVDYGPRYYFEVIPAILLLTAIGLREFLILARRRWEQRGGTFLLLTVAGFFGITLMIYLPEAVSLRAGPWKQIDDKPYQLALSSTEVPAVIFMEVVEGGYPNILSGFNHDSPWLDGDYIFCVHQTPEEDMAFMDGYPGRAPYLLWFDGRDCRMAPWTPELAATLVPGRDLTERHREGYYEGD